MAPRGKKSTPKLSIPPKVYKSIDSGKNDRKRGLESGSKDEDVKNHKDSHKKLHLESVIVAKHDIGDGWLASMLEYPVCLKVPRDLLRVQLVTSSASYAEPQ